MLKPLSVREEEIVELCVQGLTNEGIAHHLGLSLSTVNTYWLRIKVKVGGHGRTDTVLKVIQERGDTAKKHACGYSDPVSDRDRMAIELRAALGLVQLAIGQIQATAWATDRDLVVQLISKGECADLRSDIAWGLGKTILETFHSSEQVHAVVSAHLSALKGDTQELVFNDEGARLRFKVSPLSDEAGNNQGVLGIVLQAQQASHRAVSLR